MEQLSNDHEDHPNQLERSHELYNEMGHLILSLMEFNGKWDNNSMETETATWSEFPNGGKAIVKQILVSEDRNKFKVQDNESHSQDASRKVNYDKVHQI